MESLPKKNFKQNVLIMYLPLLLPAIPLLIWFGESAILLLLPMFINLVLVLFLASKLDKKDAIAYSVAQYSFFFLLWLLLWAFPNVGLALIIQIPMIYITNTTIVFLYFRLVKNKKRRGKILVLFITLILTLLLYSEHYGANSGTPILFRLFTGNI